MKPGWDTSEAHMTLFANVLGAATVVLGFFQASPWAQVGLAVVGGLTSVLTTMGYQAKRTELKSLPPFLESEAYAAKRRETGNP